MAIGTEAIVVTQLLEHLETLVTDPSLPIKMPGILFPAAGTEMPTNYLVANIMLNSTVTVTLDGGPQMLVGILQVSVNWAPDEGIIKPLEVARLIVDHYKNKVFIDSGIRITINAEPWAGSPMDQPVGTMTPVSIPFIAFEPEV